MADAGLVIIGAGLSGLTTALFSRDDFLLLEKSSRPGGLLKTEDIEGFLFDFTGHWLHLRDPRTKDFIADLMGDGMVTVNRKAAIWSNGVMTLFPFQANLFDCRRPSSGNACRKPLPRPSAGRRNGRRSRTSRNTRTFISTGSRGISSFHTTRNCGASRLPR